MIYQEFFLPIIILHSLSWNLAVVDGAKILGLFAHPSESHFAVMRSLMLELTKREHNVTVYSSHRLNERIENLREIIVEPQFPFWKQYLPSLSISGAFLATKFTKLNTNLTPYCSSKEQLMEKGQELTSEFLSHSQIRCHDV